jgi:uncharacterized protein with FMN-binding domain
MFPKRGAIALVITGAGLALLLSFKTPEAPAAVALALNSTPAPSSGGTSAGLISSAAGASASAATSAASAGSAATSAASSPTSGAASASGTYTGAAAQTRYGTVQVQISVASGKITDVQILQYPSTDPHSSQISQYALPTLISETLQAQSAQISSVSGATFTSQGYLSSLQSALDQVAA